jgi:hypothetical protein
MMECVHCILKDIFLSFNAQNCIEGTFAMNAQSWGEEISWNILDESGNQVYSSIPYVAYEQSTETVCLPAGCYVIELIDSFGDGWNNGILLFSIPGIAPVTYYLNSGSYQALPLSFAANIDCGTGSTIFGCTDSAALNYNPWATIDDGTCNYQQEIYGCTDPNATNYNPWATIDNGSCTYPLQCDSGYVADLYICVFSQGENIGFELIADNGDVVYSQFGFNDFAIEHIDVCLQEGVCYTGNMYNAAGPEGWYNGYFWVNGQGVQYVTDALYPGEEFDDVEFSIDGTCGEVFGCIDSTATNYNPLATTDNGSCVYPIANDLCADATPIQPGNIWVDNTSANLNENIWGTCWASGSGEGEQTSVWYSFTTPNQDDFRVTLEAFGNGTFTLTDTQFGVFEECGGPMIACDGNSGNGLFSMLQFECGDLAPNTSYLLLIDGYFGDAGTCWLNYEVSLGCEDPVYGCTDATAVNYNPNATLDDGSCLYVTDSCNTYTVTAILCTVSWGNEISFDIIDQNGTSYMYESGFQNNDCYDMFTCAGNGCYTLQMYDTFGDGWNGGVISIYVSGVLVLGEVTMPSGDYISYDFSIVDTDCDSVQQVYGCTDSYAWNYNPWATIDDGSCQYQDTTCYASWELIDIDEEGDIVYIMNNSYGQNLSYFWDFGDGSVSTEAYPTHQYAEDGTYIVCLTVSSGQNGFIQCTSTYCDSIAYYNPPVIGGASSVGFWLNVGPDAVLSIDQSNELNALNIFPNPTQDRLTISFDMKAQENLSLHVLDLSGKVMSTKAVLNAAGHQMISLDVSSLAAGTYLLDIQGNSSKTVRYFTVLR